jgi:DMSO reductase anchor subunit
MTRISAVHRAFPLIVFTTASGAGFGLLALLGVLAGARPDWLDAAATLIALVLVAGGLLAARRHLGRPGHLMLALRQWRTSWLSREAVATAACAAAALGFAALSVRPDGGWLRQVFGVVMAVSAVVSVVCTAMIYASLRPVPQWHTRLVPACFLAISAVTGSLLLVLLTRGFAVVAVAAILAAWALKTLYWRHLDNLSVSADGIAAAGLDRVGRVRLLDAPLATGGAALTEMGGGLADPQRLRRLTASLLFALPLGLSLLQPFAGGAAAVAAVVAAGAGVLLERWLFFAEARHVSSAWFGAGR